jgi:hypothetical protein
VELRQYALLNISPMKGLYIGKEPVDDVLVKGIGYEKDIYIK